MHKLLKNKKKNNYCRNTWFLEKFSTIDTVEHSLKLNNISLWNEFVVGKIAIPFLLETYILYSNPVGNVIWDDGTILYSISSICF